MADQVTRYTLQFDADTKKLLQGLQQVERQSKQTEKTVKSLGQVTKESFRGIGFGDIAQIAAGTALITKSVQAYGQLVNVQQTATQVFGEGYAEISAFAKQAVEDVGLSERAAIEMTTKLAGLGKAAGISSENLGKFSISLTRLGADLGAAFNTSTQRAVEAMMSALSGSSIEPLREYNIVLNDIILKQELQALTGEKVVGTMTQQQRTLAVYSKLIKSTADYQGQWDREASGLLGTQQRLAAEWENLSAQMGENYAPTAQAALDVTLGLSRAFMSADNAMGGLLSGVVGFGAAALAISPLVSRLGDYNKGLIESGRAGTAWQKTIAAGPPVIYGLTAALAGLTVWQAQTTKGAAQATEGLQQLGEAGDNTANQLASLETIMEGVGKATAGPAESFTRMWEAIKSGDGKGAFKSAFFGPLFDYWEDRGKNSADEMMDWFNELAAQSPKMALLFKETALANPAFLEEVNSYGLGINFMTDAINRGIIAQSNAVVSQTELDAAYDAAAADLGVATDATRDYNAALTEDIDKIKERVEFQEQLTEAYLKMAEARPGRVAEEFAKLFAADTGLDALDNIRTIRDTVASFAELEGTIPSIADTLDPENELAGAFLDGMQSLQDQFGPALEQALTAGGESALQTAGGQIRQKLGDALREAGYQDDAIQEIFAQLGLQIGQLDLRANMSLEATISEEAQTLLDLARGEGLISFQDYLKLRASLDVDPAGTKNAVEAMLADQGIEVPLEAGEEVDFTAAATFMAEQKIPIPMEGKLNAAAEKAKIQTDVTAKGPVKVPMEGKLDLTAATNQVNSFVNRPRTIVIGVTSPSAAALSGGGSQPGGGGQVGGTSTRTVTAPTINHITNHFTIPTADPSAHMRAAQRWSRLNGQPTPQITRGR